MKFKATISKYDVDTGEHIDEEVEFNDVESYSLEKDYLIVKLANGDQYATSENITKFSLTN